MTHIAKKGENDKFNNYARIIKLKVMIYVDFKSILLPKNNRKQNPDESYTNKYQTHVRCSFGH